MTDNMQRARELLAAEYEKHGRSFTARTILSNPERVGEDFNRALRAIAAALRLAVPEWRPIETAPRDGTRILLNSIGGAVWMGHWVGRSGVHVINGWTRYNCVDVDWNPTHWMPLPDAPMLAAAPTVSAEGEG